MKKLIALLIAATLCTGFSWNPDIRKENGVFFETNDGQIIITGDSQIWNVENMDLKNGNKVRVKFDTNGTADDKTDDEITNVRRQYIPRYSFMYNLARQLSDGTYYILDLYQVESVEFLTNTIQYNFEDGTALVAIYE